MSDSHFKIEGDGPDKKRVWVNLKPDIDLGHILAMITFAGGLFTYAQTFDRRMTILEQRQEVQSQASTETKADIKEIKKTVNEMATSLAVQNAISQIPRK